MKAALSFTNENKYTVIALLKAYRENPTAKLRTQLVQMNTGLVKKEVGYWLHQTSESYDDLLQIGFIGLMGAIDRFELSRGYAFSSFATRYIRGEIQHYLRDRSSILRVPRRWEELYQQALRSTHQLQQQLGRDPSDREIAQAQGITLHEWLEIKLAHRNRTPLSLDAPTHQGEDLPTNLSELVSDPRYHAQQGLQEEVWRLHQAIKGLEQRTRQIIEYVFLEDLPQKEVANLLGLSPVTVSRQVKKGLSTLKHSLSEKVA